METIACATQMQAWAERTRQAGKTIALVPTMGCLHEGHLSLMRLARKQADYLVVSIFVNPTQFAPHEDFDAYPRQLEQDLDGCRDEGADVVFTPQQDSLYTAGFQTYVITQDISKPLCGASRPAFFRGVTTVVTKLFHMVDPHVAVFGEKDYQQLMVIRQMAQDLNFNINIIGAPTVREADGLAMSSRNTYLSPDDRRVALSLYQSLSATQAAVAAGETDSQTLIDTATRAIARHAQTRIDYIAIVDPLSLEPMPHIDRSARMALAVFVGGTRLIDNIALYPAVRPRV